jgi:DNA mismatch endonuclease, patch repair protein
MARITIVRDPLSKAERSKLMAKVRSRGNQSTEMAICVALRKHHIVGWRRHPKNIAGHPDFYFPLHKLAVFVDGCFWHACPKCGRTPKTHVRFWSSKIQSNRLRDLRVGRSLRREGISVLRIWEHDLVTSADICIRRVMNKLTGQKRASDL